MGLRMGPFPILFQLRPWSRCLPARPIRLRNEPEGSGWPLARGGGPQRAESTEATMMKPMSIAS
eukprot:1374090-Amorphochlora_amoeboformis.AAC.1